MAGKSEVVVRFLGDTASIDKALSGLDRNLNQAGAHAERLGRRMDSSTKSISGSFNKIGVGTIAVGSMFGALAATGVGALAGIAASAVTTGIQTASSMEQAQVGFTTLIGSAKKAEDFLSKLSDFAAATPFEMNGLIDASRTLLGVGVAAKDVIPTLTAFGDAAGAVGLQQDAFQRIMVATSQAIGAGKFQTADLNQIMNNGLPVWTILSKAMHKTVPELRDLASKGKLLASDVMPALMREMHKDYGGAMARQSQTLAGLWSTLSDTFTQGMAKALVPLLPVLKDLATKGIAFLGKALGVLSDTFSVFVEAVQGGETTTVGFLGRVGDVAWFIHDAVIPALDSAFTTLGQVFGTVAGFVTGTLVPAIRNLATQFMTNVWPSIQQVAAMVADNLQPAIVALGEYWTSTLHPAIVKLMPVLKAIGEVWLNVASKVWIIIGAIIVAVTWIVGKLIPAFLWIASKVAPVVVAAILDVAQTFSTMSQRWSAISGAVMTVGGKLVGWFNTLNAKLGAVLANTWQPLYNGFEAVVNGIRALWNSTLGGKSLHIPGIPGTAFTGGDLNIPRLASGGIVKATPGGVLALLGEGGHDERVEPLDGSSRGGGGTVININVAVQPGHEDAAMVATVRHLERYVGKGGRINIARGIA